ncbi:MAG: acyl-CoA dehydrogenase, partial [Proteobacteria bacterium]|nr:acyl-CoA dehydrogenase [Pseudomonadota bacterium]
YGLNQEHEMIASTVRSFVEKEIYPHENLIESLGEVPSEIAQEIKNKTLELGFYACNFPDTLGCAGLNHLEFSIVERELGRGSMALNHFFGRPQNILMACEGDQIDKYLMPAIRGERMDALAMTEPGAGSDIRSMTCSAKKDKGDWVINGTKHFISGADHADFIIVFVATGSEETSRGSKKKITTFLVDRGTPGFTIRDGYKSVSHRGYKNMILEFSDCRIPETQVLGKVDGGFDVMNTWLYATRITVAAMSVGRSRRVFDYALNYAATREQFGQKIGRFQGVSFQLADMITEIDAADFLTLAAADKLDNGSSANREIASAKLFASEMLARVTDKAIQIHGGMGLMNDLPLERFWRDARVERIWDGTSEIQRHIISRDLLRALGA